MSEMRCAACGKPIAFTGVYWDHVGDWKPRHPARPARSVPTGDDTREQLATYAHDAWAGWMRYLFEKSTLNADGTVTIPAWAVERWQRQVATPYAELPESEKASDRAEADKMLEIVRGQE